MNLIRQDSRMPQDQPNSQDKILYQIKRLGPQTAKALSEKLNVTTMGIRQHLSLLEGQELIRACDPLPQKRGRPVKTWKLTGAGHARFPDAHAQVTTDLIINIRDLLGEAALDQIIEERAAKTLTHYESELSTIDSLEGKIKALAQLRSEEGYMAEFEKVSDTEYLLIEQHCPICIAASACHGFCRTELQSFQQLFKGVARVERKEYLLEGARRCTYLIKART